MVLISIDQGLILVILLDDDQFVVLLLQILDDLEIVSVADVQLCQEHVLDVYDQSALLAECFILLDLVHELLLVGKTLEICAHVEGLEEALDKSGLLLRLGYENTLLLLEQE